MRTCENAIIAAQGVGLDIGRQCEVYATQLRLYALAGICNSAPSGLYVWRTRCRRSHYPFNIYGLTHSARSDANPSKRSEAKSLPVMDIVLFELLPCRHQASMSDTRGGVRLVRCASHACAGFRRHASHVSMWCSATRQDACMVVHPYH